MLTQMLRTVRGRRGSQQKDGAANGGQLRRRKCNGFDAGQERLGSETQRHAGCRSNVQSVARSAFRRRRRLGNIPRGGNATTGQMLTASPASAGSVRPRCPGLMAFSVLARPVLHTSAAATCRRPFGGHGLRAHPATVVTTGRGHRRQDEQRGGKQRQWIAECFAHTSNFQMAQSSLQLRLVHSNDSMQSVVPQSTVRAHPVHRGRSPQLAPGEERDRLDSACLCGSNLRLPRASVAVSPPEH